MYNRFLERDSSESSQYIQLIAFSRNDSFLVTTGGILRESRTKTWNLHTGTLIHTYDFEYTAGHSIDVSPDNTKIISPNGARTSLLRARWTPVTSVKDEGGNKETMIVYPNPATDYIDIAIDDSTLKDAVVKVYDVLGVEVLQQEGHVIPAKAGILSVRLDVSTLPAGVYFVRIGNKTYKFVKM